MGNASALQRFDGQHIAFQKSGPRISEHWFGGFKGVTNQVVGVVTGGRISHLKILNGIQYGCAITPDQVLDNLRR